MNEPCLDTWIVTIPVTDPGRVDDLAQWLEDTCDASPVEMNMAEQSITWLEAYFETETDARVLAGALRTTHPDIDPHVRFCAGQDWTTFWRHHFHARPVGDHLIAIPEWLREETDTEGRVPLWIRPGLSFGTGDHFTTRYCLEALDRLYTEGALPGRMFDAGCGSAILSIAARKLSVSDILAVDFDAMAVEQARHNLELNDIRDGIELRTMDLTRTFPPSPYPLVVANLYGGLLMDLAPRLKRACSGVLVLSGIRAVEADAVSGMFARLGARELRAESDHEWCGLTLDCSPASETTR